jgi:hypothetical protein
VSDHLHGEKNGRKIGNLLNIVVKNVVAKRDNNHVDHRLIKIMKQSSA